MCFNELQEFNSVHITFTEVNRFETNLWMTFETAEWKLVQGEAKVAAGIMRREHSLFAFSLFSVQLLRAWIIAAFSWKLAKLFKSWQRNKLLIILFFLTVLDFLGLNVKKKKNKRKKKKQAFNSKTLVLFTHPSVAFASGLIKLVLLCQSMLKTNKSLTSVNWIPLMLSDKNADT